MSTPLHLLLPAAVLAQLCSSGSITDDWTRVGGGGGEGWGGATPPPASASFQALVSEEVPTKICCGWVESAVLGLLGQGLHLSWCCCSSSSFIKPPLPPPPSNHHAAFLICPLKATPGPSSKLTAAALSHACPSSLTDQSHQRRSSVPTVQEPVEVPPEPLPRLSSPPEHKER